MFLLQHAERGERCRRAVSREYGRARKGTAGFTLLEVQVAMLLLLVALMSVSVHGALQHRHLAWIEQYGKAHGIVDLAASRVVMTLTEEDGALPLPTCDVVLLQTSTQGQGATADVQVTRNPGP